MTSGSVSEHQRRRFVRRHYARSERAHPGAAERQARCRQPVRVVGTDLNTLPVAALARIEVLPDGASAIYGTDAIAGVINFITRKDYQRRLVAATAQLPEAGGGEVGSAKLARRHRRHGHAGLERLCGLQLA